MDFARAQFAKYLCVCVWEREGMKRAEHLSNVYDYVLGNQVNYTLHTCIEFYCAFAYRFLVFSKEMIYAKLFCYYCYSVIFFCGFTCRFTVLFCFCQKTLGYESRVYICIRLRKISVYGMTQLWCFIFLLFSKTINLKARGRLIKDEKNVILCNCKCKMIIWNQNGIN